MGTHIKIIVTIGPSTCTREAIRKIKDKGVDFVRVNMSHSSIDYLKSIIHLVKEEGLTFIIDTEGSQIRTGDLVSDKVYVEENQEVKIFDNPIVGDSTSISFNISTLSKQLEEGDLIYADFDTLILRVSDVSTASQGYIITKAVTGGYLGKNKGVIVDSTSLKKLIIPTLSEKDFQSIQVGLEEGIGYIAGSFMRSGKSVEELRKATQNTMRII